MMDEGIIGGPYATKREAKLAVERSRYATLPRTRRIRPGLYEIKSFGEAFSTVVWIGTAAELERDGFDRVAIAEWEARWRKEREKRLARSARLTT
jgi:hypothetical protein